MWRGVPPTTGCTLGKPCTEVVDSEGILLFQPFNVRQKQDTHGGFQENELTAVDSGGDVVDGVLLQASILPHNSIYGFKVRGALIFEKKVCVPPEAP